MKPQFLLPATVVVSVALVGIMKLRKGEHEKYEKQFKFQDVRLRVADDVLGEYQNDKAEKQNMLEKANTEHKALEEEVNKLQTGGEKSKGDTDACQADLVSRNIYQALLGSHGFIPFVSLLLLREERASGTRVWFSSRRTPQTRSTC